jgi:hypothetical protein
MPQYENKMIQLLAQVAKFICGYANNQFELQSVPGFLLARDDD